MGKRFGEQVKETASAAEQRTDSLLLKVANSKWSWAIVAGALLAAWLLG